MKTEYFLKPILIVIAMVTLSFAGFSKNQSGTLKEKWVTYTVDGKMYKGYVVYDGNVTGKRPAILVVHEWWGLNDYSEMRARKLAGLGYIAMAVDLFGDGKTAANPTEAQEFTAPYYKDPALGKTMLDAAIQKIREFKETDANNIAAIGYCFGGYVVLNAAKLGADFKGVVSFHGGLGGVPPDKKLLKAKILACHGADDKFVTEKDVESFRHQLDSIGAVYSFKIYPDATHAFTNPDATKLGKEFNIPIAYNAAADKASWSDMKMFFDKLFGK